MAFGNLIVDPVKLFKDIFNDVGVFRGFQISGGSTNAVTGNNFIVVTEQSSFDDSEIHTFLVSIRFKRNNDVEFNSINKLFNSIKRNSCIEYTDFFVSNIYMKKPFFRGDDLQGRTRYEFEISMNILKK